MNVVTESFRDSPISLSIENDMWEGERIIFNITPPNNSNIYMSFKLNKYNRSNSGIVIVSSNKFLDLWRNYPYGTHKMLAHGSPKTWQSDYKYEQAAKGFSYGYENPVPLASISCESICLKPGRRRIANDSGHYIGFTNGITRTIWLLTQGCIAFPVECEKSSMAVLHALAGLPGTEYTTAGELAEALLNRCI